MIKFFRQIRLKLLGESKTASYFKYAIGEIILVVIGILIALQINTWNEQKKTRSETQSLLAALKDDLVQDTLLITGHLPFIQEQYAFNEKLRSRVADPAATVDTLEQIVRFEFNPNWRAQIIYNTNSFNSLNETGLIEELPDSLKSMIKTFYNRKFSLKDRVEKTTRDYQEKITSYVNTYTFGSTPIHDQGPLIDSLVWSEIDYAHLAATFQGISNFKRILFTETQQELEYSLSNSREIIRTLDLYLSRVK